MRAVFYLFYFISFSCLIILHYLRLPLSLSPFPLSPFPTTSILHCITPVYILLYSSIVSRQGSLRGRCVEKICSLSYPDIPTRDCLSEDKRHKVGQRGAGAAARPIRYGCVEMKVASATHRLSVTYGEGSGKRGVASHREEVSLARHFRGEPDTSEQIPKKV